MVATLIAAAISTAQAQDRTAIIPNRDGFSCGKWTNTPKRSPERVVYEKWVFGYLSGINIMHTGPDWLALPGRDVDGLKAWIDNYCRRNPLHPVTQAAHELIKELQSGR
jgi:hypothetical protein